MGAFDTDSDKEKRNQDEDSQEDVENVAFPNPFDTGDDDENDATDDD